MRTERPHAHRHSRLPRNAHGLSNHEFKLARIVLDEHATSLDDQLLCDCLTLALLSDDRPAPNAYEIAHKIVFDHKRSLIRTPL